MRLQIRQAGGNNCVFSSVQIFIFILVSYKRGDYYHHYFVKPTIERRPNLSKDYFLRIQLVIWQTMMLPK